MRPIEAGASVLELWGGVECTVNRVGDRWLDQVVRTGHHHRDSDVERLAGLGVRRLRYPVLWERSLAGGELSFAWSDARLAALRGHGVKLIVGLIHHGSGPPPLSLEDPAFAGALARYAGAVAARYPWVDDWCPVNEPLTTARFSGLYGLWYPHRRSERAYWHMLLNQVDAVRLSMEAIRQVIPRARLVQTEDLGRTFSTRPVAAQAQHDNDRRWLTWDLLCGRVVPGHPMWQRGCSFGLEARLADLAERPCPPDVVGINHYLTSDRFLDHRTWLYPPGTHGGNHQRRFADVEAVRVVDPPPLGVAGRLTEAWERYRRPLAITECHNASEPAEQLRWLGEVWAAAQAARGAGIPVEAVTAWSLLGDCDWDSLVCREAGHYQPGAFDVSGPWPTLTRLGELVREVATTGALPRWPELAEPGWWRRPQRLSFPAVALEAA